MGWSAVSDCGHNISWSYSLAFWGWHSLKLIYFSFYIYCTFCRWLYIWKHFSWKLNLTYQTMAFIYWFLRSFVFVKMSINGLPIIYFKFVMQSVSAWWTLYDISHFRATTQAFLSIYAHSPEHSLLTYTKAAHIYEGYSQIRRLLTYTKAAHIYEGCSHIRRLLTYTKATHKYEDCSHIRRLLTYTKAAHIYEGCSHIRRLLTYTKAAHIYEGWDQKDP